MNKEQGQTTVNETIEAMETMKEIYADHPFMKEHGLSAGVAGIKEDKQGNVFVPVKATNDLKGCPINIRQFNERGEDHGFISGDDPDQQGVFVLGDEHKVGDRQEPAIIGTDFNDAASVHLASGRPVMVAFDAENQAEVIEALKESQPERMIAELARNESEITRQPGDKRHTVLSPKKGFDSFAEQQRQEGSVFATLEKALSYANSRASEANAQKTELEKGLDKDKGQEINRHQKGFGL